MDQKLFQVKKEIIIYELEKTDGLQKVVPQ